MVKRALAAATALAAMLTAGALAVPSSAAAATRTCPATFQVLHDDRIGAMVLPAGPYEITVTNLGCQRASRLFARFLQDWDGNLPAPWRANAARRTFRAGARRFTVAPSSTPPTPPTPLDTTTCPGTFSVLHDDRIGRVALPRGRYVITLLAGELACADASAQFAAFLDHPSGVPRPWTITGPTGTATFSNARTGDAFAVARTGGRTHGGGRSAVVCERIAIRRTTRIGTLALPAGVYEVTVPPGSTLRCAAAIRRFQAFLARGATGRWILDAQTGAFARSPTSTDRFVVDPVAGRVRSGGAGC